MSMSTKAPTLAKVMITTQATPNARMSMYPVPRKSR